MREQSSVVSGNLVGKGLYRLRLVSLVTLFVLGACRNKADIAEQQYDMVRNNRGSADEICARGKAWLDAVIEQGDADAYRAASASTRITCEGAEYNEQHGLFYGSDGKLIEADNMEVPAADLPAEPAAGEDPVAGDGAG